ncbi:MAG TPA: MDR family MFS transporter [Crenalkalicoccus sp.]|nr:MDR family MFS transporter [Crenalkalicoccus sp.]
MSPIERPSSRFSRRETLVIIAGLMLGMFLAALDQTIVAAALPRIAADLGDTGHMVWVVSAYLLTSTAATPVYGKLSDLYGRKVVLQAAIAVFLLASVLCGLATTMGQLIAFRALQGVGGGGLIAVAHATIADVVSPRERGRYQGYFASVFAAASVTGPALGGLFASSLTWRWVFWINLPLGLAALAMSQVALKRLPVRRSRPRIDYLGALLIAAAAGCAVLLTAAGGNDVAWNSPLIEALACGTLVLLILAVIRERRAAEPILPPRLFRQPAFVVASVISVMAAADMLGLTVFTPPFLRLAFGLQDRGAGLMLMPLSGAATFGAVAAGRLVAATGRYKLFPIVGLGAAAAAMLLLATVTGTTPPALATGYLALAGGGLGLIMPVMLVAVQNVVEARDIGSGTASVNLFRSLGGAFGVALFGAVLRAARPSVPHGAAARAAAQGFHGVFLVGALIAVITLVIALFLRESPLRTTVGAAEEASAVG